MKIERERERKGETREETRKRREKGIRNEEKWNENDLSKIKFFTTLCPKLLSIFLPLKLNEKRDEGKFGYDIMNEKIMTEILIKENLAMIL